AGAKWGATPWWRTSSASARRRSASWPTIARSKSRSATTSTRTTATSRCAGGSPRPRRGSGGQTRSCASWPRDRFRAMAQVLPAERDLRRVIGDGEKIPDGEVGGLSEEDLLELDRRLVLLRTYDERSVVYHRQGRIGTYAIFWGHEAMQVGGTYALEDADWIFPSYRESAIGLLRGMPPSTVLSWWRGHPAGWWNPADWNVASICVPIGTHVPHAAGLAWGKRLRGESACALTFFGDGATSEGAFHEGAN